MKTLILYAISFFILGCSSTSLSYTPHQIKLSSSMFEQTFDGKTHFSKDINLAKIFISQHIFEDTYNELLVYEYARLDVNYTFKFSYRYTLEQLFEAKKVKLEKNKEGLDFYIITLKDNSKLYALVKTNTKSSLHMIYGFSEENFMALLKGHKLSPQATLSSRPEESIKSKWSQKLLITGALLNRKKARPLLLIK